MMDDITFTETELRDIYEMVEPGLGFDEFLRSDYSGRGMWGDTCLGFVLDGPKVIALGSAITDVKIRWVNDPDEREDLLDSIMSALKDVSIDQMGLNIVVYSPSFKYSKE